MPFKLRALPVNVADEPTTPAGNTAAGCCQQPSNQQSSTEGCGPDNPETFALLQRQLRDRLAATA